MPTCSLSTDYRGSDMSYQMCKTLAWANDSSMNHGTPDLPMTRAKEGDRGGPPTDWGCEAIPHHQWYTCSMALRKVAARVAETVR